MAAKAIDAERAGKSKRRPTVGRRFRRAPEGRELVRRHSGNGLKDPTGDLIGVGGRIRTAILEIPAISIVNEAMGDAD